MAFLNPIMVDQIEAALSSRDAIACAEAIGLILAAKNDRASDELRTQAEALYGSDELEIDDVAGTSEAEFGTWVQAWVWVPKATCGDCGEPLHEDEREYCSRCSGDDPDPLEE
jgi:hypothetical protein